MITLILAVFLVFLVVLFVAGIRPADVPPPEPPSPTAHLEEKKARIYDNLRDLQFEYRLGKLSDDDYQRTKLGLQKELAGVLAEIDQILGKAPAPVPVAVAAAVAAPTPAPEPVAESTTLLLCPHCGATFDRPLKFCGECGKSIAPGAKA